jgi:hypothetical protein
MPEFALVCWGEGVRHLYLYWADEEVTARADYRQYRAAGRRCALYRLAEGSHEGEEAANPSSARPAAPD